MISSIVNERGILHRQFLEVKSQSCDPLKSGILHRQFLGPTPAPNMYYKSGILHRQFLGIFS